jgi:membrane dipeptidase
MRSIRILAAVLGASSAVSGCGGGARPPETPVQRVERLLREVPLVDGHNDLGEQLKDRVGDQLERLDLASDTRALRPPMHTDIPRLRRGGVGGQFWSAFVSPRLPGPEAAVALLEQIDVIRRLAGRYPETFEMAATADDVERIHRSGRIACLIGIEGGHALANSLAALRIAHGAGARYVTLTHWNSTSWADAATDAPRHGGLSPFGVEMVREMNRLGVLVDLSHVSDATMNDVLDLTEAPVIFSHSSARAVCNHVRNVPDDVLRRVTANGGVVMVNFAPGFVSEAVRVAEAPLEAEWVRLGQLYPNDPERVGEAIAAFRRGRTIPRATLAQVADHVDHIRTVAGIDHVGLGSDFDGISETPEGLEDVSRYPELLIELANRGYSDEDLAKVAGANILRVMRGAERTAARLQRERRPSEARIELLQPSPTPAGAARP